MSDEMTRSAFPMAQLSRLLAALIAMALPACAPMNARPANAAEAYHGPAIWKVADKDTTIYLFVTVHVLPKDSNWLSGPVERAYDSSSELVTEIPRQDATLEAQQIADKAALPKGQS